MKKYVILCCLAGFALHIHMATAAPPTEPMPSTAPPVLPEQTPKQNLPDLLDITQLSPAQLQSMARFQTETVTRILGVHLHTDGVLPEIRRADRPWQWINPLAPASYGIGLDNISTNPRTGRMEGISFFSLRF